MQIAEFVPGGRRGGGSGRDNGRKHSGGCDSISVDLEAAAAVPTPQRK